VGLFLIWDCKGTNLFLLLQNLFTFRLNFAFRIPSEQPASSFAGCKGMQIIGSAKLIIRKRSKCIDNTLPVSMKKLLVHG